MHPIIDSYTNINKLPIKEHVGEEVVIVEVFFVTASSAECENRLWGNGA